MSCGTTDDSLLEGNMQSFTSLDLTSLVGLLGPLPKWVLQKESPLLIDATNQRNILSITSIISVGRTGEQYSRRNPPETKLGQNIWPQIYSLQKKKKKHWPSNPQWPVELERNWKGHKNCEPYYKMKWPTWMFMVLEATPPPRSFR